LNIARAKATETRQLYKRTVELFNKRAASQAEVDSATANHGASRGNVRAAKSALARAERDLAHAELAAPFAGVVALRSVEPFQEVSAGGEAFVLETSNVLEVEVRVPETLIRNVDFGQAVQVSFPTLNNTTVSGVVNEIGSRAESGNAFPVSIQLSPTDADLRPGMTAGVTFNFDAYLEGKTVFLIPLSALALEFGMIRKTNEANDGKNPRETVPLFVINDADQLEARDVVVGDLRGNQVEVFEGLEEGEKIVSAGVSFVREGITVEPWTPDQGFTSG
ncbi:MAG: efflux RND transporter periplasmic adaptor subunit, partial [Gammaproteobacteria bacterium]